jgi:hypothetical protein
MEEEGGEGGESWRGKERGEERGRRKRDEN